MQAKGRHFLSVLVLPLLLVAGCGGGSSNSRGSTPPQKAVYNGPTFGDNENGGLGYTNTDILVRPPDQNNGQKGRVIGSLSTGDPASDGWYYDRYTFTATDSGSRTIELQSSNFDAVLAVFRVYPDGYWEYVGYDDDGGGSHNPRFFLDADRNGVYAVTVTSYDKGAVGNYTLLFSPGLTYVATRALPLPDFGRPHR